MPQQTHFICQPYVKGKKGVPEPQPPLSYKTGEQALQRARRMMDGGSVTGVDVVRQTVDPELGDYDEPVFLARLGSVPTSEN